MLTIERETTNRYTELTDTQKAHVDAYINALASGGQTAITRQVEGWADEARTAIKRLESPTEPSIPPPTIQALDAIVKVRHALAMMVDATTDVDR